MNIIPATNELFHQYYGNLPFAVPSMRAYFMEIDGELLAICGFIRRRGNEMLVFTETKNREPCKQKLSLMKFSKAMMKIADENGWVLMATPDADIPTANLFLEHFGFKLNENGEYIR
jgi:hypothetical protein